MRLDISLNVHKMSAWLVSVTACSFINWIQPLLANFYIHLRAYNRE